MIIFYEKDTGKIKGTIEGRVHGETHLNQWVGDRDSTYRLIVNWHKNDNDVWEPNAGDQEQIDIFIELDKNPTSVYDYLIDSVSGKLIKKEKM